jgi:putative OPT family oligopeptide transporter
MMATIAQPAAAMPLKELTIRGIILGAVLTVLFTAANVYLGLRIGITFATSIPAAVISMAVLRFFRDATIQENNIVQTIASSAGTLSAIIFVLPGLVMVGWWTGFPYWLSVAVIAIGGVLGVMYSVPLRRALVTGSDLPYPEGVAAAEVLKVGNGVGGAEENKRGLAAILASSLVSAGFALLAQTRLVAAEASRAIGIGAGGTSVAASLSMALIGVGHLVGLAVGIAMLVGLVVARGVLLPWLTAGGAPVGTELETFVDTVFREQVRFIGAGTIGVAAIWTLLKILGPISRGVTSAIAASRTRKSGGQDSLALTERDLPIGIIFGTILLSMIPIGLLLYGFANTAPIAANPGPTIGLSIGYILIVGVIIASVCGYMAGLIGASNSPISGVGILAVLGIALILAALFGGTTDAAGTQSLVAFALFVTAIVFGVATISNDNLQDLKTGQLVGATPWRQQVALILGVIFGAAVIPPILDLLNTAFTFAGAPNAREGALAAPQAALISAIAQGVLGGSLRWDLIGIGAAIGVAVIVADEALRRGGNKRSLPPLAVGMGIYLPMGLTLLIPVGALLGHLYNRWAERSGNFEFKERLGVLMATGLIVGESLFGVAFAGIVAGAERAGAEDSAGVLALVDEFPLAVPLGILLFAAAIAWLYARTRRQASGGLPGGDVEQPRQANVR